MAEGRLLALDTPQAIKEQFGEGYKLMIEPKTDVVTPEEFAQMKEEIDDIVFKGDKAIEGMTENSDSTSKKVIYSIPFKSI